MKREEAPLSGGHPGERVSDPDGVRDERKKLDGLRTSILSKGAEERERILKEAGVRAERWLADHTAQLDATVRSIRDDAVKQAQDISDRRLVEAGTSRDRERPLPSQPIMDNIFYYGEAVILGNLPLKPEENDMLISVSENISYIDKDIAYLQYGLKIGRAHV